ncbi:MAG TPA: hypothetical protein VLG47_01485 [Candidatus Saccharimonadales bacterium]|nr:hypothetical protein [Candidatus Saccharimonadales bacterium]
MDTSSDNKNDAGKPVSSGRVRFGIILWVISYLPFPVIVVDVLHNNGMLSDAKQTSMFIAVMWGLQILIGLIGLYIAGKEAIGLVRDQGVKKLPKNLWLVVIGRPIPESE